jgi:hypothetical protein
MRASLAFSVAGVIEPDVVRGLFHATLLLDTMGSLMFAAFAVAVGGASLRTGILPNAWGWVSIGVGVLFVLNATTWSREGFWSPSGGMVWIVQIASVIWIAATSVLHFREVSRATAA